jgi:hypothetical protein
MVLFQIFAKAFAFFFNPSGKHEPREFWIEKVAFSPRISRTPPQKCKS